ncbi:Mitochondrial import receptor subunit TOM20-like protein [Drosera capensis]
MEVDSLDRLIFFEHARKTAEAAYAANPRDADNLTRWGGALLELSQLNPNESQKLLDEAVLKLEEALKISPTKHETLWCLGNAYTNYALLNNDMGEATSYFVKASNAFQRACDEDPGNELYQKSLEFSFKAPELYAQFKESGPTTSGPSATSTKTSTKKKKNSDLKYDIMGWVILVVGIVAWVGFAKNHMPPPPPPPPRF